MTVSTTARRQQFPTDGATADFTFTFRALTTALSDIKCILTFTSGTTSTDVNLTYTTDFTVAVDSSGVGGTVTLVSPATISVGTLTVYRETTLTQLSDYDDFNQFPADTLETDLDKRTMTDQELREDVDRALALAISYSGTVTTLLPTPVADNIIGWDATGSFLENKVYVSTDYATVAQALTGTSDDTVMSPSVTSVLFRDINSTTITGASLSATTFISPAITATTLSAVTLTASTLNVATATIGTLSGVTMSASTLNITTITAGTLSATSLTASTVNVTTATVGTLNVTALNSTTATVTTLSAVSMSASTINLVTATIGTLNCDTLSAGTLAFSGTNISTLTCATLSAVSMSASTLNIATITCGTLNVDTISAGTLAFSALNVATITATTISSVTLTASTLNVATVTASTVSAVTLTASTLNVATATIGTLGVTTISASTLTITTVHLGEGSLKLDTAMSGDEKWSGITIDGTAGDTLAVGDLCYLNDNDGRWELVDANLSDGYDKTLGICLVAGNDGDASQLLVFGKVRSAAFPVFNTLGAPVYLSETAGDLTQTQPTTADVAIRIVGTALTAEDLMFNPSNDYIVHV